MDNAAENVAQGGQEKAKGIDQQEVVAAIEEWRKDPKWKKIFDEAPEGAKHRIALNFWVTENKKKPTFDRDVYLSLRNALESDLTFDDLEYLIVNAANDAQKKHFRDLIMNLKDDGGDAGQNDQTEGK